MDPGMTVVERIVEADCDKVFDMLSDGWLYPVWVVGATHVRDVDAGWPAPGTRIHHQVGAWPLMIADHTESLTSERAHLLRIQARGWPLGEAVVQIELTPEGTSCRVRLGEEPARGPGKWLDNPLLRLLLKARNRETLARLAALAEHRGVTAQR